ncbi:MAG: hypothetical protein J6K00_05445, partial [Oscillospiraceae bacterium]|nr:hypothetical protein [Oscillospiraceae bacterium]
RQKWANIPHFRHINGEIGTMVVLISAPDSLSFELVELFSVYSRGRLSAAQKQNEVYRQIIPRRSFGGG